MHLCVVTKLSTIPDPEEVYKQIYTAMKKEKLK